MICILQNNAVNVRSFHAPRRALPNLKTTVAVGTTVLYSSYTIGRLYCSFRRKLSVPPESFNYMLDLNQNQYAVWASGNAFNGIPAFHSQYFGSSPNTINIQFEPNPVSLFSVKEFPNTRFFQGRISLYSSKYRNLLVLPCTSQRHVQNPVKHLGCCVLRK